MRSLFLFLGAASAFIGVGMGAFGAHGLKSVLSPEAMVAYQTGVSYQMWHALGLCVLALVQYRWPASRLLKWSGWLMFIGIVLFSGGLYLLTLSNLKWLGIVTPFGGTAFLTAWLLLAAFAARKPG
ncbi:MAG: DUF423 domain-containing protein [Gammaproteobacteria bacterium]